MKTILKSLSDACATVLKGHAGDAALISKEMTPDEFAKHATDEIEKAKGDSAPTAIARLTALQTSITVAKSAFVEKELDKFEIPVFDESAQSEADTAKKIAGLEATVAELTAKIASGDDGDGDGDETDEEKAAKAKAAEDAAAAAAAGDDETDEQKAAKVKADADKAKADADKDKAAADKKKEEEVAAAAAAAAKKAADGEEKGWPMDLAKSFGDDEVRELYDWGPDPKAAPTQH